MAPTGVNRRLLLGGAGSLLALPACAQSEAVFRALESKGMRIGVAALDTGNGRSFLQRADERFLMCSTFKLSLAAAVLRRVERGEERLGRLVAYTAADLLSVSPVTSVNVERGLTIDALCAAVIHVSDNTAANLLLESIGGPAALNTLFRDAGDTVTHLDRMELMLNVRDGDKDTTTPRAMLGTMQALLLGSLLGPTSRARLLRWMGEVTTGLALLRAGLPRDWRVGDKTGRNQAGAINDLAIAYPPDRAPILIAAYTEGATDGTLAEIGRLAATALA